MAFTPEYQQLGVDGPAPGNGWIPSSTGPGSRWIQKSVRLSFDTTTLEIPADPMLGKVFYNLLDHAQKYGGGGMTAIAVVCIRRGSRDRRPERQGISAGDNEHLFERRFGKHADLWLHLSREILAITKITISEPKEPGEGAQVEIPGSPGRIPVWWQGVAYSTDHAGVGRDVQVNYHAQKYKNFSLCPHSHSPSKGTAEVNRTGREQFISVTDR